MKGARERFGCIHTHNSNNKKRERKRHDMEVSPDWHGTPMKWWTSCSQLVVPHSPCCSRRELRKPHIIIDGNTNQHTAQTHLHRRRERVWARAEMEIYYGNQLKGFYWGRIVYNTHYTIRWDMVAYVVIVSYIYRIHTSITGVLLPGLVYQCVWHYGSKSWRLRDPREQLSPLALWYSNLKRNAWESFYRF